jgi:hypothetical protein
VSHSLRKLWARAFDAAAAIPLSAVLVVAAIALAAASSRLTKHAFAQEVGPIHTIAGGPFEASDVVVPPGGKGMLFVDDARADAVFWMELAADGSPRSAPVRIRLGASVVDPEGLTTDGRYLYVVGSQSRGKLSGGAGLVRFRFDAARRAAQGAEAIEGLGALVAAAVPQLLGSGGKKKSELNIEGIAWDGKGSRLLLGLRAPLDHGQAVLVPVRLREAGGPFAAANLAVEQPIRLDLGGAGVRAIQADADGGFWIVAGGSTGNPVPSRIVRWDGNAPAGRVVATLPAKLKAEGIARVSVGGKTVTLVLCDTSQYVLLP